jgi:hypothetical protein
MKSEELVRKIRKENRYANLPLKYIQTAALDGAPEEMVRRRLDLAFMDNGNIAEYNCWKDSIGLSVGYSGHLIMPTPNE